MKIDLTGIKDGTPCEFTWSDRPEEGPVLGLIRTYGNYYYLEQDFRCGSDIRDAGGKLLKYKYTWRFDQESPGHFSDYVIINAIPLQCLKHKDVVLCITGNFNDGLTINNVSYTATVGDELIAGNVNDIKRVSLDIATQLFEKTLKQQKK